MTPPPEKEPPPDPAPRPTRREFLIAGGAVAAVGAGAGGAVVTAGQTPSGQLPQDAAAGVAPDGGPVNPNTVAHAEVLAGVVYTNAEREMIAAHVEEHLDRLRLRQAMPPPDLDAAPAQRFDPRLPGMEFGDIQDRVVPSAPGTSLPPRNDEDLAYAPVTDLSRWLRQRKITSQHLTRVYLERLKRIGPELECVITLTEDRAMAQAREADIGIAAGKIRGPLHGVPWGAKDLLDTAGIATTFGATPYRDRVATRDAAVVQRLDAAGAVMVAKLTLGALAYNNIWFGGTTRNPWNRAQGSSGSSAGSSAATAAGLVGFTLGTETYGSIVSPCMRCGTTGLRPTFGRVARTGAMPLCWSLDKIGPIARTVEDCALILQAINGPDDGDPASIAMPFSFDAGQSVAGLRVGYDPAWFEGDPAHELDRHVLDRLRRLGIELVEIKLPDWPYDVFLNVIFAESAATFEELTRSGRDDELVWQDPEAWPNAFRQAWFIPAVEYVQIDRFRRQVMVMMAERFDQVHAIISPSFAASLLLITNCTGHPSLTLRTGFKDDGTPHGITLCGRLFDEGTLCNIGMALEQDLAVWSARPPV